MTYKIWRRVNVSDALLSGIVQHLEPGTSFREGKTGTGPSHLLQNAAVLTGSLYSPKTVTLYSLEMGQALRMQSGEQPVQHWNYIFNFLFYFI